MRFSDQQCTISQGVSPSRPGSRHALEFETLEERSLLAAQILTFDIDAARSFLGLNGTLTAGGSSFTFESQGGSNSLVTSFDGSLEVELTENTIRFVSGSVLDALELRDGNNLRLFQPPPPGSGSAAAADYAAIINAGIATAEAAIRGISLDASSGILTIGTGGNFSSGLVFSFDAGRMDFAVFGVRFAGDLAGSDSANAAAGTSRLQFGPGKIELNIPIDIRITETTDLGGLGTFDTHLRFIGNIVAVVGIVDEGEPNDDFSTAATIAPIQTIEGSLAGASDVDFFAVNLSHAGVLSVRAESVVAADSPIVRLYNGNQELIATGSFGGLVADGLAAGTYYIQMSAAPAMTGVNDYVLQTGFVQAADDGTTDNGSVDPDKFIAINLDDVFGLQVGTFLFVKDLAAAMQNGVVSVPPMFLPMGMLAHNPAHHLNLGDLPTAGGPDRVFYAPASPLGPLSFFAIDDRATTGGLSQLPTFAPNNANRDARLAAALAKFGGGQSQRGTSDSAEPGAAVNSLDSPHRSSNTTFPILVPGGWGEVIDAILQKAIQASEKANPQTKPSDRDSSQIAPPIELPVAAIRSVEDIAADACFADLTVNTLLVEPEVEKAIKAAPIRATVLAPTQPLLSNSEASTGFLVVTAAVFTNRMRRRRGRRGR